MSYQVAVKYGDDGIPVIVVRGVDLPTASSVSASYPEATRFIIDETTDTVFRRYQPNHYATVDVRGPDVV